MPVATKDKKSLPAFKKSFNRRFDLACQVKFRDIIGRNLKKSTLILMIRTFMPGGTAPLLSADGPIDP
jgi:hypothetical protein